MKTATRATEKLHEMGQSLWLVPERLRNQLGIAIATRTYAAYCRLIESPRSKRLFNAGGRKQRLLWASTGSKDPSASDLLYIDALAAPFTTPKSEALN